MSKPIDLAELKALAKAAGRDLVVEVAPSWLTQVVSEIEAGRHAQAELGAMRAGQGRMFGNRAARL